MMNNIRILCIVLASFCVSAIRAEADNGYIYREELEQLQKSADFQLLFDKDMPASLKNIRRDVSNYQQLTYFQRWVRSAILNCNALVVTSKTMPKLFAYIGGICKQAEIQTPTVCISLGDGFFNAAAMRLFKSSGAIIIGKELLMEVTDDELEAIVAHEIGHIRHNHFNKILMTSVAIAGMVHYSTNKMLKTTSILGNPDVLLNKKVESFYKQLIVPNLLTPIIGSLLINKRFEKEADSFAYKTGKASGLAKFFQNAQKKEQAQEEAFVETKEILEEQASKLSWFDRYDLKNRYSNAVLFHKISKAFSWLYHNTFLGAHPSHEVRVKAAQDYLATH